MIILDKRELLYFSLKNQHLLQKTGKRAVVSDLCGLQAQFANNPKYALRIRADDYSETGWGDGLAKIWTFRGTLHAVRTDEIGLFLSARGIPDAWADSWWGLDKTIKPEWSAFIMACLAEGIGGRDQLKERCRRQGMPPDLLAKVFHGWGGLLKEMSDRGLIAYDIGTEKRFILCRDLTFLDKDEARAILIGRYFKAYAPATLDDCARFTGYPKHEVRRLIELFSLPLKSVACEGVEYFYSGELAGDGQIPPCLFLAGFDQMIMGYRDRNRLFPAALKLQVITNSGIVYPTILLDGQLGARWKKDGAALLVTPFGPLSQKKRNLIIAQGKKVFAGEPVTVVIQA